MSSKKFKLPNIVTEKSCMLAEVEAIYKLQQKPSEMPIFKSSKDSADYLRELWSNKMDYIEEFVVVYLNRANKVLGWTKISQGGVSGTVCDPKVIFQMALIFNASGIILSHNHPSGNNLPSKADKSVTRKIKASGEFLEIQLIDHIILTNESHLSFADCGLI